MSHLILNICEWSTLVFLATTVETVYRFKAALVNVMGDPPALGPQPIPKPVTMGMGYPFLL
jgi:hypothetical protein